MSEGRKPVLPLRVGAVLTVSPSIPVWVSATADALQIRAPFGDLTVPYGAITGVAREVKGGIRLNLSGTTVLLDCGDVPDMAVDALSDLLERKAPTPQL
jgi:hypothetical protein